MIGIQCTMLQDRCIEIVTAVEDPKCEFVKKSGFELLFNTTDDEKAVVVVKQALKATPEFKTVYFQIHVK